MDSAALVSAIFREEIRIGRLGGGPWADAPGLTPIRYFALLRTIPTGSGLDGLLAALARPKPAPAYGVRAARIS